MRLVASMPVRDELDRYLREAIAHLLTWCDEVRVLDDGSTDGSFEWLCEQDRVEVKRNVGPAWSENEGHFRQALFEWTLEAAPTHVMAIDADEFVPRGQGLRAVLEGRSERTFSLRMCEIWRTGGEWALRTDGGWRPHPVGILYAVPDRPHGSRWRLPAKRLACGRVPQVIADDANRRRARVLDADILHLGWSREAERRSRYERYVRLDGGRYHARAHLDSIMLPDRAIGLESYPRRRLAAIADVA